MTLRERIHDRLRRTGAATFWELCHAMPDVTPTDIKAALTSAMRDRDVEAFRRGSYTERFLLAERLLERHPEPEKAAAAGAVPVGAERAVSRPADRAV